MNNDDIICPSKFDTLDARAIDALPTSQVKRLGRSRMRTDVTSTVSHPHKSLLRTVATPEGRLQYICDAYNSTRQRWLSRPDQSPTSLLALRQSRDQLMQNSLSEGALTVARGFVVNEGEEVDGGSLKYGTIAGGWTTQPTMPVGRSRTFGNRQELNASWNDSSIKYTDNLSQPSIPQYRAESKNRLIDQILANLSTTGPGLYHQNSRHCLPQQATFHMSDQCVNTQLSSNRLPCPPPNSSRPNIVDKRYCSTSRSNMIDNQDSSSKLSDRLLGRQQNPLPAKLKQPPEKPFLLDLRRTTPRQLKHSHCKTTHHPANSTRSTNFLIDSNNRHDVVSQPSTTTNHSHSKSADFLRSTSLRIRPKSNHQVKPLQRSNSANRSTPPLSPFSGKPVTPYHQPRPTSDLMPVDCQLSNSCWAGVDDRGENFGARPRGSDDSPRHPINSQPQFNVDLDPVLDRLLSDVISIDEYRTSLRLSAATRIGTSGTATSSSTSSSRRLLDSSNMQNDESTEALLMTPTPVTPNANASSFNGALQTSVPIHDNQPLASRSSQLQQQINELIDVEFSRPTPPSFGGTTMRGTGPSETSSTSTTVNGQRLSEPSVHFLLSQLSDRNASIISPSSGDRGESTLIRNSPFRWSGSARCQKSANRAGLSMYQRPTYEKQPQSDSHHLQAPSTTVVDETLKPRFHQLHHHHLPVWALGVDQLSVLRKFAQAQLAYVVDKHGPSNRSPFSLRFLRSRGPTLPPASLAPSDYGQSAPIDIPTSHSPSHSLISRQSNYSNGTQDDPSSGIDIQISTPTPTNSIDLPASLDTPFSSSTQHQSLQTCRYAGPVFGQSLSAWQRRCGSPLPPAICHLMTYLRRVGVDANGLFRRPGGKLRTQALRNEIENDIYWSDFTKWQPYDAADLLKQFFRELPDCLLTHKISVDLVNTFPLVPTSSQLDFLRWVIIVLPDENRFVLQRLLNLLNELTAYSEVTQMTAKNLAVCFAPSLVRLDNSLGSTSSQYIGLSPRRLRRTTSGPDPKDLADQSAIQLCLSMLIENTKDLFEVPFDLLRQARLSQTSGIESVELETLIPSGDWPSWLQTELSVLSRNCSPGISSSRSSSKSSTSWSAVSRSDFAKLYQLDSGAGESMDGLEVLYRKHPLGSNAVRSQFPLYTWRCSLSIPCSDPTAIIDACWNDRPAWDPEVVRSEIVDEMSDCVQIVLLVLGGPPHQPNRLLRLIRGRQSQLGLDESSSSTSSISGGSSSGSTGSSASAIVSQSIAATSNVIHPTGCLVGHAHEEHVFVRLDEDRSSCRVYFLSRVDLRGYSTEWYINQWGHTLVRRLLNLRRYFERKNQQQHQAPLLLDQQLVNQSRPAPPPYSPPLVD